MKRWKTMTAAVLAAGAMLVTTSGAASAQLPGKNGAKTYVWQGTYFDGDDCLVQMGDVEPYYEPAGGIAWAKGGATAAVVARPSGNLDTPAQVYVVKVSPCSAPRAVGAVDEGSTPSWSPDGKQLAVQRAGRIVIINAATGAKVRDLGAGKDPSWSPDGKRIAYVEGTTIKTRPAGGGTASTFKTSASAPDYSPDGTKIAYSQSGKIKYASASNGSGVVTTPIAASEFAYSPDGTSFLFINPSNRAVVVARTSGYITERVTDVPNYHALPAWQPLP